MSSNRSRLGSGLSTAGLFLACLLPLLNTASLDAQTKVEVPPEAFRLLDCLAGGRVTVADLRDVVHPFIGLEFGTQYNSVIAIMLEAIRQGDLRMEDVVAAMEAEGCPLSRQDESSQCGATARVLSVWPSRPAASGAEASPARLEAVRREVLTKRAEGYVAPATYRSYLKTLLPTGTSPIGTALRLYLGEPVDDLVGSAEMSAARPPGMGEDQGLRSQDVTVFRGALMCTIVEWVRGSRGSPEVIAEVRSLPGELIDRTAAIERHYVNTSCEFAPLESRVFRTWREGKTAPNRWVAWKTILQTYGW